MKNFLISAVEKVGEKVVEAVEVAQKVSKKKRRKRKMRNFTEKAADVAEDVFGADDTNDVKEEFERTYKRDTSGMDEEEARKVREEDAERFKEDSEAIDDSKSRVIGAVLTAFVVAAGVAISEALKVSGIKTSAARETAMWNATR